MEEKEVIKVRIELKNLDGERILSSFTISEIRNSQEFLLNLHCNNVSSFRRDDGIK